MQFKRQSDPVMKTYTLLLDGVVLLFLTLAVGFCLADESITNSSTTRSGLIRTMVISWQTLLGVSGFCLFLRYVAGKVR